MAVALRLVARVNSLLTVRFGEDLAAVLVQMKVPRPMARRWMKPNQTLTRFSHDPDVEVKWCGCGGCRRASRAWRGPVR